MKVEGPGSIDVGEAPASSLPPFVEVRGLVHRYGAHLALDGCWLDARQGEIVSLLGPSGCGKTTLLRCIAGFLQPSDGEILVEGHDLLPVPVNRRPVGVVFQSYALFPHLTVARNVGYGLRMRGMPRREIAERVEAALAIVSLGGLEGRYPSQLSGGQQQRVAIARVMVLEPKLLLLDEPFGALDAKLRTGMQVELRRLIKRLGTTAIFVTHDQDEAMTMSDRIAVMRAGHIEQLGSPAEIFDRPATPYVADFLGASNFLAARSEDGRVALPDGSRLHSKHAGPVQIMIRPHNIALGRPVPGAGWTGRITFGRHAGATMDYEIATPGGQAFRVVTMRDERPWTTGEDVALTVRQPDQCVVFPA